MKLNTLINKNKNQFDKKFKALLHNNLNSSILSKAMFYGCNNGGKRIRPFLVKEAAKIANLKESDTFIISASIELIHSYSLIHDDLPSMDNDDYRRGKLSTHKKFNEATAILAGDAIHDLAFSLLSGKLKSKNLSLISENFQTDYPLTFKHFKNLCNKKEFSDVMGTYLDWYKM